MSLLRCEQYGSYVEKLGGDGSLVGYWVVLVQQIIMKLYVNGRGHKMEDEGIEANTNS